jgi:hypothetical protein
MTDFLPRSNRNRCELDCHEPEKFVQFSLSSPQFRKYTFIVEKVRLEKKANKLTTMKVFIDELEEC